MSFLPGWNELNILKLAIDSTKIDGDLTDFPVNITLSSSTGQTGFNATPVFNELTTADRKRIAVTTSDGTTQCPVEIEYWDSAEEKAHLCVKVPTVASGTDTELYFYYDSTKPTNSGFVGDTGEVTAQGVWDSHYKGVWHLNEATGSGIVDSTINAQTSSIVGSGNPSSTTGIIGGAFEFGGVLYDPPNYFKIDADASLDLSDSDYLTISAWFNPTSYYTWDGDVYPIFFMYGDRRLSLGLFYLDVAAWMNDDDYLIGDGYGENPNMSEWNHAVIIRNPDDTILYLNGVQVDSVPSVTISGGIVDCYIGGSDIYPYDSTLTGFIDEVRVSTGTTAGGARSPEWIKAEYYSGFDNLVTFTVSPDAGYRSTKLKLIIDSTKIDEDLTDFPVNITLSSSAGQTGFDASAVFYELTIADSKKIVVTTSDGTTQCPVEIEYWDSAEEKAHLCVKVPTVASGTDTELWFYYDSTAPINSDFVGNTGEVGPSWLVPTPNQAVWDSYYKCVLHLNEDSAYVDSTRYDRDITNHNGSPPSVSGIIDKAYPCDGEPSSPNYLRIDTSTRDVSLQDVDYYTISTWFKPYTQHFSDEYPTLFTYGDSSLLTLGLNVVSSGVDGQLEVWVNQSWPYPPSSTIGGGDVASNLNEWNYAVLTKTPSNMITYLNGVQVDSVSTVEIDLDWDVMSMLGGNYSDNGFTGDIDEFRISSSNNSNACRSPAWIKAEYYSGFDNLITLELPDPPVMQNRMKIIIHPGNVDNTLTDFPVMINLSSESGKTGYDTTAIFDELPTADRKKIGVTTSDGTTQCPVEIEYWDSTERKAILWTKIPTIAFGIDTDFYLYYDNSSSYWSTAPEGNTYVGDTGEAPAQQVWDDNFVGVWHMGQDPSGGADAVLDSTISGTHGTSSGTMTSEDLVDGKIGEGIDFDGVDDSIDCGGGTYLDDIDTVTIESVFKAASWGEGSAGRIASKSTSGDLNGWNLFVQSSSDYNFSYSQDWSNVAQWQTPTSSIILGYWYHGVVQYDRSYSTSDKPIMYLNGVPQTVTTATAPTGSIESDAAQNLVIGARASTDRQFEGIVDEVRISNIYRSAAWIKATYLNNWDNFVTFGVQPPLTMQYKMSLTIPPDNLGSSLIDFPVMINLSSSSGKTGYDTTAIFDELSTVDRKKIAITTASGEPFWPVEIEYWDSAERKAILWTKVPTVYYGVNTDFYLYYDSTATTNSGYVGDTGEFPAKQVWNDNFVGVWHMAQDPSAGVDAILNSTSSIRHGTSSGTMLTEDLVDGKIGKAIDFDGVDDKITTTAAGVLSVNPRTVEVIFKAAAGAGSSSGGLVFWGKDPNGEKWNFRIDDVNGALRTECQGGNCIAATSVEDNNWHYGVSSFNGTDVEDVVHYLDGGIDVKSSSSSYTVNTVDAYRIIIGAQHSSWYYLPATVDEVRVSNVARSDAWIRATYHSNWDDLIIYGYTPLSSEVTPPVPAGNVSVNDYFIFRALNKDIYRTKLTIDGTKIDGDLIDFPVNVTLSSGTGQTNFNTEHVFETLKSYKFLSYDNRTKMYASDYLGNKLSTEIERWDQDNKEANLWVKASTVSSGIDTILYLCYNPVFEDQIAYTGDTGSVAAQNAWDKYFTAVWHMSQDPSGGTNCIIDSTGSGTHGTPDESMTSEDIVNGKIWKAIDFEGFDDVINCGTNAANDMTDALTLEAIFKTDELKTQMIIAKDDENTSNRKYELYVNFDQSIEANIFETTASSVNTNTNSGIGGSFIDDNYHHVAVTIDTTGQYKQPVAGLSDVDSTPASGTVNELWHPWVDPGEPPKSCLIDDPPWFSYDRGSWCYTTIADDISAGFDLGSVKTVVRIKWWGKAVGSQRNLNPYCLFATDFDRMEVYMSNDNYTWTLAEQFDNMLVEDYALEYYPREPGWDSAYNDTWILWATLFSSPKTARYFKLNTATFGAMRLNSLYSPGPAYDPVDPEESSSKWVNLTLIEPFSDVGNSRLYVDGVLNISSTDTGTEHVIDAIQSQPTVPVLIGNRYNSDDIDYNFDGILDEIRVSSTRRSAEWVKATYYSNWDDLITYEVAEAVLVPGEVQVYNTYGILLGTVYHGAAVTSVWASNDYLYIGTKDSGVLRSPMSSISGSIYYDLNPYKTYPDINNESVNYIHGNGDYLCVATISGVNILDLTTNSGIYSNTSILANQCHQLSDRTSYYIYDNKLETVYSDDSTYIYQSGDGIIPTVSGITDLCAVDGDKNLILLATTEGAVVIEEDKGNESNCRFKYYYKER